MTQVKTLCAVFVLAASLPLFAPRQTKNTKMLDQNNITKTHIQNKNLLYTQEKEKIEKFIITIKPGNDKFAKSVSSYIIESAQKNNIHPYIIATTGYVESEFDMNSRPCIGIMQVLSNKPRDGLNPHNIKDNIELGSRELSYHYHHRKALASRGGDYRLRYMWGRYNGCGVSTRNTYIKRVMIVHNRLRYETPSQWENRLKKQHTLWKN